MSRKLSVRVEQQIEGVLREKEAPCQFFTAFPPTCQKGYSVPCPCAKYKPREDPGELEPGLCLYEFGHVVHLMRFNSSDGFYRRGMTWCGRKVDEAIDALEIYDGDPSSDARICLKCQREKPKI